jgi:60 kDa SS-A/Ro ribonucleoprotein
MKLNILKFAHLARPRTHEGAPAAAITPEQALRRSVLACMLWENEFYESGVTIADRIRELVPQVEPARVAALAVEARSSMKLRHAPLLLVREMARHATHRALVAQSLTPSSSVPTNSPSSSLSTGPVDALRSPRR